MHYNCLIVDDEEELARMTAEYFRMFDVSTEYVTSREACYTFLKEHTADLILLDINLGDGTGFEVCKRLRDETQIPILFISARQSDDDVLVALSIGGASRFIRITVRDAGPGVPEEELAQITGKYFRGSNAAGQEGYGLGMYLVKWYMEKQGGGLEYYNDNGFVVELLVRKV